jgi:hypothetical protein
VPITPAPPPRDDGGRSNGNEGGPAHAAALEQLRVSPADWRADRQNSLSLLLPDAPSWTRVKFWAMPSLVGFRYGKEHHAVIGGTVLPVADESAPGACSKAMDGWTQPWIELFDISVTHGPPRAVTWNGKIVDIDALVAETATLADHDQYAAAYATYPAWKGACLVIGIAIPARGELARAVAVRDRFVIEVLPTLKVTSPVEPKERD